MADEDDEFQQDNEGVVAPTPRGSKEMISYFSRVNIVQGERIRYAHVIPAHDKLIVGGQMLHKPDPRATWSTWIDENWSLVVDPVGCVVANYGDADEVRGRWVEPVERDLCYLSKWATDVEGLRQWYLQSSAVILFVAWVPNEVF
jgi:hypothetical protein